MLSPKVLVWLQQGWYDFVGMSPHAFRVDCASNCNKSVMIIRMKRPLLIMTLSSIVAECISELALCLHVYAVLRELRVRGIHYILAILLCLFSMSPQYLLCKFSSYL